MEELGSPFPQSFPQPPYHTPAFTPNPAPEATANLPTPSNTPHHLSTQPLSADEVVKKYPRLRGDSKIALARECFFGKDVMSSCSVGGRGPGTTPLPEQGMSDICRVIFSLSPAYLNQEAVFKETVW